LAATVVLGTTLRAIGRGFGSGTLGLADLAEASIANADNATASARLVLKAVHRIAAARAKGVTVLFRSESSNRASSGLFH
jgi:hypothetical protein